MNTDKEFGKFSLGQLNQLIAGLSFIEQQQNEVLSSLRSNPEKIKEIFTPNFNWAELYEFPFVTHLTLLIKIIGIEQYFKDAATSTDPQQAILDHLDDENLPGWTGGPDGQFEPKHLAGVLIAIMYSFESMVVHSKYLNELVQDVRKGNDSAFFKAVQVDRTVLACPTFADRISRAELEDDSLFFVKLGRAIKTKPNRPKEEFKELRFMLQALEEGGAIQSLTIEKAYQLLCVELKLYPIDGEDPARSLWRFISRWKKARWT